MGQAVDDIEIDDTLTTDTVDRLREATKEFLLEQFPDGYTVKSAQKVIDEGPRVSCGYCTGQMVPVVEYGPDKTIQSGGWFFRIEGPVGVLLLNCERAKPRLLHSYWSFFVNSFENRRS